MASTTSSDTHGQAKTPAKWAVNTLRVGLVPVTALGVPLWPILAITCAVPFLSLVTIPLFIALSGLLLYSIAWLTYLFLAQSDTPNSSTNRPRLLPLVPLSPQRCVKVTYAALQCGAVAFKIAFPAVLDWSYRRVMILGTAAGSAVVREGILYDAQSSTRRLDVYLPPASYSNSQEATPAPSRSGSTSKKQQRRRKHSTQFDEPPPAVDDQGRVLQEDLSRPGGSQMPHRSRRGAPVIVFLPSPIPPIGWTNKRKAYLQLAMKLRRMGNCVVVPDIAYFPDTRIRESVVDVRLVLRWVGDHIQRYGGDPSKIHLMGHGLSAHLALLTLTQEAVVLSREGILELQAQRERRQATVEERWQAEEEDRQRYTSMGPANSPPRKTKVAGDIASSSVNEDDDAVKADAWVDGAGDETGSSVDAAPGVIMPPASPFSRTPAKAAQKKVGSAAEVSRPSQLGQQFNSVEPDNEAPARPATPSASGQGAASYPATPLTGATTTPGSTRRDRYLQSRQVRHQEDSEDESDYLDVPIPNGLRRVEIYSPEIEVPPVAGLILFSGISDVIKGFRYEIERGIEDLSVLRRAAGPSHTSCLLHSPAHLLYASKNLLDAGLLPPKILLIHGGKDSVVPIEQSTLLKTLLVGVGVSHVKLRAYRKLGHAESIASLFLGMGRGMKRYSKMIAQDVEDFLKA